MYLQAGTVSLLRAWSSNEEIRSLLENESWAFLLLFALAPKLAPLQSPTQTLTRAHFERDKKRRSNRQKERREVYLTYSRKLSFVCILIVPLANG